MNCDNKIMFFELCIFLKIIWISSGCAPALQSKRLDGSVFMTLRDTFLYTCAAECASDVLCKSFNFNIIQRICELSVADESDYPEKLGASSDYIYSHISDWDNVPLGPCQTTTCAKSQICQVLRTGNEVCGESSLINVAKNKPASSSSIYDGTATGARAVDGNRDTDFMRGSCMASTYSDRSPWWQVDIKEEYLVLKINIVNRQDSSIERLRSLSIEVYDKNPEVDAAAEKQVCLDYPDTYTGEELELSCTLPLIGRFVRIQKTKKNVEDLLQLCEVDVFVMELKV